MSEFDNTDTEPQELDNQTDDYQSVDDDSTDESDAEKELRFTQDEFEKTLAKRIAKAKRKWQREQRRKRQHSNVAKEETSNQTQPTPDVNQELEQMRRERAMFRFERWASKRGIDDRALDLLASKVDLSDPDSWDDEFEAYADFLAPRKPRRRPPKGVGGSKPQPDSERPPVGDELTDEQRARMSYQELYDYAHRKFTGKPAPRHPFGMGNNKR